MKKFVSAVLSAVICLGTLAVPVTASAYDKMDLNKDGKVNIMDTIYLNRYLMGEHYVPDYGRLDVDNSMTVDANDANCLTAAIVKNDYSTYYYSRKTGGYTPVSSTTSTAGVYPVTGSRTYARYSYKTGKQLSNYTLTLTSQQDSTNGQGVEPYVIVNPTDTRYEAVGDENKGIVNINGATGFIVGDHQIATAGHCVSKDHVFKTATPVIKMYNRDGTLNGTKLTPVEVHVPTAYLNLDTPQYDYALITVSEDLSSYPHFEIGDAYNVSESGFFGVSIYVTGCAQYIKINPETGKGTLNTTRRLYSEEGDIYGSLENNRYTIQYTADTSGGQSGSPVYTIIATAQGTKIEYSFIALATHRGGSGGLSNVGARFNRFHRQFYLNNSYMSY